MLAELLVDWLPSILPAIVGLFQGYLYTPLGARREAILTLNSILRYFTQFLGYLGEGKIPF